MTTETNTPTQAEASTALLRAARAGQIDKILALLRQDVDINVSNANGLNAIHLASKDGHAAVVAELLRRGAHIDAATKKGNTALHIASLAGQEAVVRMLVQNGAQVNIQSQNGFTPLYMAAQENHDEVVRFLLASGANQSLATEDGFTPLAVAMQQGHEKVVSVLLESDTRGRVRLPALHIAAKKDDVKAANLLLENEHNPDVTSKSGFTPLHIAAHYGNEQVARLLLVKSADVNSPAKHNICPLHVAAKWGKENMVTLLCDNGANVEARTRDGLTPLHCAARSGHERVVELLLDRGSPITSKSKNGLAPLHMAAQGDHAETTRVLLIRKAPVDDVTVDYLTALHVAAHCGHVKAAKLLLDKNADANARALNGFTPLHIACKKNRIKVVELLLKHGASISATTESGLTPLHVAAFMGCMNIVIYLLQHEASPDVPTVRGETPLHLAARANQTDIIRILLRNGAAVEAKAREQQTPLHIASRLGNVDIAVLLLQHGADVGAPTSDHYNALHIAAKQQNHDVAAALIEHGAPLTATTKKGFTPLHLAAKYGNLKVANLLLSNGASPDQAGKNGVTPLHVAAQYEQQAVAQALLEKGADAKAVAKNGHTPLHIASRKNQMEIAGSLLEHGAGADAESKAGFTPLHLAAQQGHVEMCSLLIEHGAEVDHQAKNGLAALHLAAQEDRVPVARMLIKNGAQVDICSKGGYTPLHVASHYGQTNMVRYLLESEASVAAQTSHGYTALHHAAQQGHINIVNLLLEHKADPNDVTANGQTPLDIAWKLGYVTVMETLKGVSDPSAMNGSVEKYRVVAPETMYETFMSDSEEEGGEDNLLTEQPYRYLTADDMKSLGDDSMPIDVTRDERAESVIGQKNIMELSQGSVNGLGLTDEVVVKSVNRYSTATEGYCYNVDPDVPKKKLQWKNFLVSFLVDARGGAMRGCRGGGVRVIVPPLSAQQPTRITCRYLKPSRINHMPPLMEGEALASRVLEMGPVSAKFLGPVMIEVPHYASLRGCEREVVVLRSDNGTSWREHTVEAADAIHDIRDSLDIQDNGDDPGTVGGTGSRVTRILTHDFPQYFAVISRIRQEVHAIGPEGGMVSSSVVPQVQAVFPQGALTKKIKVGLQAQIIDSELTAKLLGRGVAVSPVVTVEPRRRKFHKAITLSMPAPRPHTQGMTNQYGTSSAPTLRLLCSISGGTNRAHWEDVTDNTPLTFVNDCVSFTTTVSARYWLIDCRHVEDATKMATELYREAIHVPFMARFLVYARRTEPNQAQLRMFCVTDDREDKTLERMERFSRVVTSKDVEVHEGKPCYLEIVGNLTPIAKSGEQLTVPFRAFRENRLAFIAMVKNLHSDPVARCQFMREPKTPKGEPTAAPICVLNIVLPEEEASSDLETVPPILSSEDQEVWRQRLNDPRLVDISNLLGKDWMALAYELGVSVATVNQIQNKRIGTPEQAQLMLKLWRTQSGTKARDNSLELALCRIGRDDIILAQSDGSTERRLRRNIYQERQASEEYEAYKADEDNRKTRPDDHMSESELREQEEAKYSPEEKSVHETSERELTPSPSEASEEDADVKRSVAERKAQITRKLSSNKVSASKQKKEIRDEIYEIKTQIKPVTQETVKLERTLSKTSPESIEEETPKTIKEAVKEEATPVDKIKETPKQVDMAAPAKPTPKHLHKHMRNESVHRFSSGDFSDVIVTPRKLIPSETADPSVLFIQAEIKPRQETSQKEIATTRAEEYLGDGDESPDLVSEGKDIAEASLKQKISSFESKMSKQNGELTATSVKLTKEALKKHTLENREQENAYTQEFVREQAKLSETVEKSAEVEKQEDTIKPVKHTVQQFDSKIRTSQEERTEKVPKFLGKSMRTDSTIVQVSWEEDSGCLKKSTDSETETESQTTVKVEIDKKEVDSKQHIKNLSEEESFTSPDEKSTSHKNGNRIERKIEQQLSVTSTKSELSKTQTKTDSGSDIAEIKKLSQESSLPSQADLQQSTERDVSFISSQTESRLYSKDSKQRSDSLSETSQFSDLEHQDQSPAHRPSRISKYLDEEERTMTHQFLQHESEYSSKIHETILKTSSLEKVSSKDSPVISAKARQFIESVPEDDSVQECFFSKRICSDSLEDSEQSDSRRHSEAESLKSDQSESKVKISSSEFDERTEFQETVDSGSGFGHEKFEESIGFTSIKFDTTLYESKTDSDSDNVEEPVFKKMTPKRHLRTESISISKLSDLEPDKSKQEFQIIVTEAEETTKSFDKEDSEKNSSGSSREIEISDRKSSEGVSDKISSEDGVTEKRTSSEEDNKLDDKAEVLHITAVKGSVKEIEKLESKIQILKDEATEKIAATTLDHTKRQSVVSSGSADLRLEEKRPSDAHSLTESRDYTFEESEDSIGPHVAEIAKIPITDKQEITKPPKLQHGDSLDDVEAFPEDHVIEHIHKLPNIEEVVRHIPETKDVSEICVKEVITTYLNSKSEQPLTKISSSLPKAGTKVIDECTEKTFEAGGFTDKGFSISTHVIMDIKDIKTDITKDILPMDESIQNSNEFKEDKKNLDIDLNEASEVTKEELEMVIDKILEEGSKTAESMTPVVDKDIRKVTEQMLSAERTVTDCNFRGFAEVKRISDIKAIAENIEIVIKQASEEQLSTDESLIAREEIENVDEPLVEEERYHDKEYQQEEYAETKHRVLLKSLSRDSGEGVIISKKKQSRTYSVQSSPEDVDEQIYTDSESDMDKAKVLEIIEPASEDKSILDDKKLKTDSLDDADELLPEKGIEASNDQKHDSSGKLQFYNISKDTKTVTDDMMHAERCHTADLFEKSYRQSQSKQYILKEKNYADVVSTSTTSATTVDSSLSTTDDGKYVIKGDSKDALTGGSKASIDIREDEMSKKSLDLTKDSSKSSVDSKDTLRDFATTDLSKDSTADSYLSKISGDSVKDTSNRSLDEKTFSDDYSPMVISRTLATERDICESSVESKESSKFVELVDDDQSVSKTFQSSKTYLGSRLSSIGDGEQTSSFDNVRSKDDTRDDILDENEDVGEKATTESDNMSSKSDERGLVEKRRSSSSEEDRDNILTEMKNLNRSDRRCSDFLEEISQGGALIRIDSTHVSHHDLSLKFSKTPPSSPVDLSAREKTILEEAGDKHIGLQPKGSDSSFLDAEQRSPCRSSVGDSLYIETEAHQSELLTEAFKVPSAAATPKSPTRHLAENLTFVNVSQPTISTGIELVNKTIERSIGVVDQIKQEQLAAKVELETLRPSSVISKTESSSSTSSKVFEDVLKFESIDPEAVIADLAAKVSQSENLTTVLTHRQTETSKISGQEFFSETRHISSSDDDSLVIMTEIKHELSGQEHEVKEKTMIRKDGDETQVSQKKMEKSQDGSDKRCELETMAVFKNTDDTEVIIIEREFVEHGLYTGRQTKSEEKMTAIKDETVKKTNEVKYSERDLSHEQWGKEYFSESSEPQDIGEDEDSSKIKEAFIDYSLKIRQLDETVSNSEFSEKGKVIKTTTEHFKEESVIESEDHDEHSSGDFSHEVSFRAEPVDRRGSSELSPKSRSKSYKKESEVYEVDFVKEIKVSTSPVPKTMSRTVSQDSELEVASELPYDDKSFKDGILRFEKGKSPVKIPHQEIQDQVWEVSVQRTDSFEEAHEIPASYKVTSIDMETSLTKSSESVTLIAGKTVKEVLAKSKPDLLSPTTADPSDEISTSKDVMIKSEGSVDTEYMVKSLESHEGEALQQSMDSTVSAETLHRSTEFSTDVDSAFLTGTDHRKDELKLVKEKSLEDICSSGYDTDLSSAEFHGTKLDAERVDTEIKAAAVATAPFTNLSVLEKTIDEVKQSLEAAQVEILSEKSDGSSKYKQSPSEFEFKDFKLMSPDRPEMIKEESFQEDVDIKKSLSRLDSHKSDQLASRADTLSEEERNTIKEKLRNQVAVDSSEHASKSDSGPYSILETESEIVSEKDESSKDSKQVMMRINNKHLRTKLVVGDRYSASDIEGYSSSGESHYQSFEHSDSTHSRPLSSDVDILMTGQSTAEFETACTNQDGSSRSMRTSKDYHTAISSLTSRESMRSLDSDASSHLASIDISDASETLVPSSNELKEELMESGTFTDQFVPEGERPKDLDLKTQEDINSDEESSVDELERNVLYSDEPLGKMKRSHEMRFPPKEMISENFLLETIADSIDLPVKEEYKEALILEEDIEKKELKESETKPFKRSPSRERRRELVDIESEIIEVGTKEYEEIFTPKTKSPTQFVAEKVTVEEKKVIIPSELPGVHMKVIEEVCAKTTVTEVEVKPFPIAPKSPSQREFVDIESQIIPVGTAPYKEITKHTSKSSVICDPQTSEAMKSCSYSMDSKQSSASSLKSSNAETYPIGSKQSSTSSFRSGSQDFLSTPHTPGSMLSQSSESTDNGKEYVLDDIFDISETPEMKSDQVLSERSEMILTTEERTLYEASGYRKDQESPTSDEFEMLEKPGEMDDFVVIEEVAKEASETDQEGKGLKILQQKYVKKHDEEVEELLLKASKKQEAAYSTSSSLSDEEMQAYEAEQRKIKSQEHAEVEAGKRWLQTQFEGDPRYEYERVPLEDIKEEEMTDFDASRIGSLSSQKESVGSAGSIRNSYGSLSESEMMSRRRFMVRGEQDDVSISSLQEFENLEKALMDQYQQTSSSSQDSLNGSLPRHYQLRKSGDDASVSSLKEFEGLENACLEAMKAEIEAKQKEALLLSQDVKVSSSSFLEQEKRSYSGSSESSPPQKSSSPGQKSGSPSQKGSPGPRFGSPQTKPLTDPSIKRMIDQSLVAADLLEPIPIEGPSIVVVKKFDEKGAFFVPEERTCPVTRPIEITEDCKKVSAYSCITQKDMAESLPGDCEEMMKLLDLEKDTDKTVTRTISDGGVVEVVRTTKLIQQRFVDGKKVSETISAGTGVDIPGAKSTECEGSGSMKSSEILSESSSSATSQQSDMDSVINIMDRHTSSSMSDSMCSAVTVITGTRHSMSFEKPDDLELSRSSDAVMRELSPSSGKSVSQLTTSGKHIADPASGSWSGQDEDMSSSGSLSRSRAELMLGSTDSLEATSSNATRATYNYEVDTPMTGSLTSGGSNTMVSSLDTLEPMTALHVEGEHECEVPEPDSGDKMDSCGQAPRAKQRTVMFDSTDTLSAVSGDGSVETPAATFYIGDAPRGEEEADEPPPLSGSCPASLPPLPSHQIPPIPAQRRSLSMVSKTSTSQEDM